MKTFKDRHFRPLIYLLSALIFFLLFLSLADEAVRLGNLHNFDSELAQFIYRWRSEGMTQLMTYVTNLASTGYIVMASLVLAIYLYLSNRRFYVVPLLASLGGAAVFTSLFKLLLGRPRPELADILAPETGFSFPSGHTLIAVCFYGVVIYFLALAVKSPHAKVGVILSGSLLVLMIGISRVYLGVHWPSDVIGSLLLGGSWLLLLAAIFAQRGMIKKQIHSGAYRLHKKLRK